MNKNEVKKESNNKKLEIIVGDNTELDISDVGDCVNNLRPKSNSNSTKIIPKNKK